MIKNRNYGSSLRKKRMERVCKPTDTMTGAGGGGKGGYNSHE